jgi:hypothetical protein
MPPRAGRLPWPCSPARARGAGRAEGRQRCTQGSLRAAPSSPGAGRAEGRQRCTHAACVRAAPGSPGDPGLLQPAQPPGAPPVGRDGGTREGRIRRCWISRVLRYALAPCTLSGAGDCGIHPPPFHAGPPRPPAGGRACRAPANPGQARPGQARPGQARPGQARPGQARRDLHALPGSGPSRPPQARPGRASAPPHLRGRH